MEFVLQFHDANGHVIQIACRVVSFSLLYVLNYWRLIVYIYIYLNVDDAVLDSFTYLKMDDYEFKNSMIT